MVKNFSYRTNSPMILKLGMEHYVNLYEAYINDDPELTMTYLTTMSNLAKLVFVLIVGPGRYQVSIYRTIGPVFEKSALNYHQISRAIK